jgi:DUF971 family protein
MSNSPNARPAHPGQLKFGLSKDRRTLSHQLRGWHAVTICPPSICSVESPSAEVQGHGPNEKKTIGGQARMSRSSSVIPVGHYAVKLVFDDMHDTGIYGWDTLATMGRNYPAKWQAYLDALALAGLTREPVRRPPRA